MTNDLERQILNLVATDRLYIPSSSFDGKLEKRRKKSAQAIDLSENPFDGERVYARVEEEDKDKARGMREGIEKFAEEFPKYGKILNGMIEEQRTVREKHLYFGVQEGKRLTNDDYMAVLKDMGLGPATAERYCEVALDISRNLTRKRNDEERSVLIG
ncbi:MAG: hypothetical protein RL557_396 [archaeon]|jgi:hypothetical protein